MKEIKKRRMELIIIVAVLALAILVVSVVSDGIINGGEDESADQEPEQTVLELVYAYQNPQWNAAIEDCVEKFEEAHPDIRIEYEVNYEHKVYEDILSKKIARNELGDIVQLKTPLGYAQSDVLGEISREVANLVTSIYVYDEKIYGVGAVQATSGILYNKKIFEKYNLKEPENWWEFLEICRTLRDQGVVPIGVAGSELWHMEYWVNHFFRTDVLSKNENWLADCADGNVSWTDQEPAQMMSHLSELFSERYVNGDWQTTVDGSLAYKMSEEEIAMIYTGPWTARSIKQLDADMDLGWFYVPDEHGTVYAGENLDTFWSVTKECAADGKKYEAAMTFLKWFYQADNYSSLCKSTFTYPLTKDADLSAETDIQADIQQSFLEADRKIPLYIGNEDTPQDFEKNMLAIVQEILADECSEKEGLKRIQKLWKQCQKLEDVP